MATDTFLNGPAPKALPTFAHPTLHQVTQQHPKSAQSAPDSHRRHSLPLHFLPPSLWSANTSSASLVETEEAARGEHILDEATVAHRISALRQLNGATRTRHRYAKSTGARNSTFSQPVIVRTYSGTVRLPLQQRNFVKTKKENGLAVMANGKDLKLPPVEAFTFKGIMEEIKHGVAEDLERIAEICARSKYSLSNQYEVHMPPHGRGEAILQTVGLGAGPQATPGGPTLQAVGSDDEQPRTTGRGSRGGRRTKSVAYGTLETIMSSSRSSEEDKAEKKPAAVIAEGVRGRAAQKQSQEEAKPKGDARERTIEPAPEPERPSKHVRSKSATFASIVIDNAQGFKNDAASQLVSPTSLISEPARPQTSTAADMDSIPVLEEPEGQHLLPTLQSFMSPKPTMIRNESRASTLRPDMEARPSILSSINSWLPWTRPTGQPTRNMPGRMRSTSHAEGSLRDLLKTTDFDRKGKGVDRTGGK